MTCDDADNDGDHKDDAANGDEIILTTSVTPRDRAS